MLTIDELDPKAKSRAIDRHRDVLNECFEPEWLTGEFAYVLERVGFPTDNICWRLSCCQGDGVAFYGSVDMSKYLAWKTSFGVAPFCVVDGYLSAYAKIERRGTYYDHWNTMAVSVECDEFLDDADEDGKLVDQTRLLEELLASDIISMSKALERYGYYYLEGEFCDERIIEDLRDNDVRFTEDGDRVECEAGAA